MDRTYYIKTIYNDINLAKNYEDKEAQILTRLELPEPFLRRFLQYYTLQMIVDEKLGNQEVSERTNI